MGGDAMGVFAFGGASIGLLMASGGMAVGEIAFGGLAVGYYALAGTAFGVHANDTEAWRFLGGWHTFRMLSAWWLVVFIMSAAISSLAPVWAKRLDARVQRGNARSTK